MQPCSSCPVPAGNAACNQSRPTSLFVPIWHILRGYHPQRTNKRRQPSRPTLPCICRTCEQQRGCTHHLSCCCRSHRVHRAGAVRPGPHPAAQGGILRTRLCCVRRRLHRVVLRLGLGRGRRPAGPRGRHRGQHRTGWGGAGLVLAAVTLGRPRCPVWSKCDARAQQGLATDGGWDCHHCGTALVLATVALCQQPPLDCVRSPALCCLPRCQRGHAGARETRSSESKASALRSDYGWQWKDEPLHDGATRASGRQHARGWRRGGPNHGVARCIGGQLACIADLEPPAQRSQCTSRRFVACPCRPHQVNPLCRVLDGVQKQVCRGLMGRLCVGQTRQPEARLSVLERAHVPCIWPTTRTVSGPRYAPCVLDQGCATCSVHAARWRPWHSPAAYLPASYQPGT
jgi:hypothetical protein